MSGNRMPTVIKIAKTLYVLEHFCFGKVSMLIPLRKQLKVCSSFPTQGLPVENFAQDWNRKSGISDSLQLTQRCAVSNDWQVFAQTAPAKNCSLAEMAETELEMCLMKSSEVNETLQKMQVTALRSRSEKSEKIGKMQWGSE